MWTLVCGALLLALLAFRVAVVGRRLAAAKAALASADRRCASVEREMAGVHGLNDQLRKDQQFLIRFLREFRHLTQGLHGGVTERQIPGVVLTVVMETLQPGAAMVLVRRAKVGTDPARGARLVVAAAQGDSPLGLGSEITIGQGELGFAAEAQLVMNRQDFEAESAVTRHRLKQENPQGLMVDLAAPIVLGEETLGLIALSGCQRTSEDAKAVLRLIAQTGAQAMQSTAAYSQMKTTADLDGLTKVFNKRHVTEALAEHIFEAQQRSSKLSIFLMDIDNFKNYNDVNGHVAGDKLLQMLASLVQENVRKNDVFGRFGGEEFLLILPGVSLPQAMAAAYKIRAAIQAHPFPFAKRQPLGFLSISGGVAEYPADALDSVRLLRTADEALYLAKSEGRNRVLAAERRYLGGGEPEIGAGAEGEDR